MSSEFLFSFLMFFQVQMDSIRQSGFYQLLEEKYPQISEGINDIESDKEVQEILKLTGLEFDDLQSFSLTLEGLEGISKVQELGRAPKIGSELDVLFRTRVKGEIEQDQLIAFMLDELEDEKGKEARDQVEKTKRTKENVTYLTIPVEVMDEQASSSDLLLAVKKEKDSSDLFVGIPKNVEAALKDNLNQESLACLDSMSKKRQVTFAIKVDPAIWDRPEFGATQQNPLFAGLANSVKGIREVGFSVTFLDESLGLEFCVNCIDTQSALGLWTVAQGGLGMAQLAMGQEGSQVPSILSRVKTQAVEKNVFVRVEVLPSDLEEFESQFMPPSASSSVGQPKKVTAASDPLIGKKAPGISTKNLKGEDFKLSDHKGKVIVLDFWATWCGPCVRALPELQKATSSFNKKEVALLAVNQGESKKVISKFLKKKQLKALSVIMDESRKIGGDYKVKGIPKTVIIDQNGVIRYVHVGFSPEIGNRLKGEIQNLLSE
jgi:peroxiredoxin